MKKVLLFVLSCFLFVGSINITIAEQPVGDPTPPPGAGEGADASAKDPKPSGDVECQGVKLNTNVPFIGRCIEYESTTDEGSQRQETPDATKVTTTNAFGILIGGLAKMVMTAILIISFLLLVIAGISISANDENVSGMGKGKEIIYKVMIGIALLGLSSSILYLINPNFFK